MLSNPKIVEQIGRHFVPVALNLYEIRGAKDAGGEFFRAATKAFPNYQGIWMATAEGKALAAHQDFPFVEGKGDWHEQWRRHFLATIDEALKAFGPVEPRPLPQDLTKAALIDPVPLRGVGVQPDGKVMLAVSTRYVNRERTKRDGPAVIDNVTLPADQWQSLFPPKLAPGTTWQVPEAVARQFSRTLSPTSDQSTMFLPKEVTAVQLTGKVVAVEDGIAQVAWEGKLEGKRTVDGKTSRSTSVLTGVGRLDARTGQPLALLWVLDGHYTPAPPYDQTRQIGAVAEWRQK